MRFNNYDPGFWLLDDDPDKSAQMLTNEYLEKSLKACMQCMLSAYFYRCGCRSSRAHAWLFSKERRKASMDEHFPGWPYRGVPGMTRYTSRQAKWTRKSAAHFFLVRNYLDALVREYEFRFGKPARESSFLEWSDANFSSLKLPPLRRGLIALEYKCLPPKYRLVNVLEGIRRYYANRIGDPLTAYSGSKRPVPDFVMTGIGVA